MLRLVLFLFVLSTAAVPQQEAGRRIYFHQPAREWVDGLPLGNGTLGAMVLGGVQADRIALNHNRLWRRSAERRTIKVADKLPEFRRLFLAGRYDEAGRLMERDIMVTGGKMYTYVNPFQPLGDLLLEFSHDGDAREYRRQLDLDSAVAEVTYQAGGARFRREYFTSAPQDNVLVVRITAGGPGSISGRVRLERTERDDAIRTQQRTEVPQCSVTTRAEGDLLVLSGRFHEDFSFAAAARVTTRGGTARAEGDAIRIEGAGELLIVLAMATGAEAADPAAWCEGHLRALRAGFQELRARHVSDHRRLFRRVRLALEHSEPEVPADQLIEAAVREKRGSARLFQLLFDFGRYLLISASRPGGLPMNLQGIWNDQSYPPWDSDYHMDLNLEFNYWPAEVTNLSELHQPLFDWMEARIPDGRRKARDLYGCRGVYFSAVGDATGLGNPDNICFSWPGAAGWLAQHFWWHWEFTGGREFLARRAFPFLKEVAAFFEDYLVKDAGGKYVIVPSCSPENGIKGRNGWTHYTTISSTIDLEIAREVFTHAIRASEILDVERTRAARWREIVAALPEPRINPDGRLEEFSEPAEPKDPAHRHLSPLYALFPGERMTPGASPELASAARRLLEYRLQFGSGSSNGWSFPWRTALFARLFDGNRALGQLDEMARCCVNDNLLTLITDWRRQGLTIGWFGGKKIFQVEANMAATAAIAEMLLQGHGGVIRVLPALPERWPAGSVSGLVARGGFVVDIAWRDHRAERVKIHSRLGNLCRVKIEGAAPESVRVSRGGRSVPTQVRPDGAVEFKTAAGAAYDLTVAAAGATRNGSRVLTTKM